MLSKRLSIQWPPESAGEDTETMVIYSKQDHFVDIRVYKSQYPVINETPDLQAFKNTFEWTMIGDEIPLEPTDPNTYVLKFTHEIDSLAIVKSIEQGKPLEQCLTEPDVGTFSKLPGTEDRKETGHMINPATGKDQNYIEIWRSLSANKHSLTKEVRETPEDIENDPNLFVLRVDLAQYHGQLIRTGNWCQGILHNKNNSVVPLNVVRAFYDEKWNYLIKFGDIEMPLEFGGRKGDHVTKGGIEWECIE